MSTVSVARVYSEASQMKDFFEEEKEKIDKNNLKLLSRQPVDDGLFKTGLSCLGKTCNNGRHAYLSLTLAGNNLVSVVGIDKYRYLQNVDVSNNKLIHLKDLSALKHMVKLKAAWNQIRRTFDFEPPANLEYADYTGNAINKIERADRNAFLKTLILDQNNIQTIEGLQGNKCLKMLSLNGNSIDTIENLDGLHLQELHLQQNRIRKITGLSKLPALHTLDLSRNQIAKLKGLQETHTLRFLKLQLNSVGKIGQLQYVENLPLLTEFDLACNPVQNRKFYRLQVLFHIP